MRNLFFIALILISSLTSHQSNASIVCHTPNSNKIFEIKNERITFLKEFDTKANREIASFVSRSKINNNGFTKIVQFENQKHTIHIEDSMHFSDVEDYIIIKAKSGNEVIYPLTCNQKL